MSISVIRGEQYMKYTLGFLILLLIAVGSPVRAWDDTGHQMIADIAWTRLQPEVKQKITLILKAGDPRFTPDGKSDDAIRYAFRKAATFPDVIRTDTTTAYEKDDFIVNMNLKWIPSPKDPRDDFRCKTWHYYDMPIRVIRGNPGPKDSNALKALTEARTELARLEKSEHPDRFVECWWLYWIEHVTGDLHHPLHCVSDYEYFRNGDAGGNKFQLGIQNNSQSPGKQNNLLNLHFYWDNGISKAKQLESNDNFEAVTDKWLADKTMIPDEKDYKNLDIDQWLAFQVSVANTGVYNIRMRSIPTKEYEQYQIDVCKHEAVLAGYRLAETLNGILK